MGSHFVKPTMQGVILSELGKPPASLKEHQWGHLWLCIPVVMLVLSSKACNVEAQQNQAVLMDESCAKWTKTSKP